MPKNIEIKAMIHDYSKLSEKVSKFADEGPFDLAQEDTFFHCHNGRLKLRKFSDKSGELVFYKRENLSGPKVSDYQIFPTNSPQLLRNILEAAFGVLGTVRKMRKLFKIGQTRIHLDCVEGLGAFLELEVVLKGGEEIEFGKSIAEELLQRLEISPESLVEKSYLELLLEKGT